MGWTSPLTEIFTFERKNLEYTPKGKEKECFVGTGTGFDVDPGTCGFLFVRATDLCEALNPWDVIPCEDVHIADASTTDPNQAQKITFAASVHERESGWYHLIGWRRAERRDGAWVNQACIYEFALKILPRDPEDPSNQTAKGQSPTDASGG